MSNKFKRKVTSLSSWIQAARRGADVFNISGPEGLLYLDIVIPNEGGELYDMWFKGWTMKAEGYTFDQIKAYIKELWHGKEENVAAKEADRAKRTAARK